MYTKFYHVTWVEILETQISVFHILQRNVSILHCKRIRQKGNNWDINSREFVEAASSFVLHIQVSTFAQKQYAYFIYIYIYIERERERERERAIYTDICMYSYTLGGEPSGAPNQLEARYSMPGPETRHQ